MEKLTLTLRYESKYKNEKGNDCNVHSMHGSPEAIAQYVADKVAERGSCPMMGTTNIPRFTTTDVLGATCVIERSVNGKWYVEDSLVKMLESKLKQQNLDETVKGAIAQAYVSEFIALAKSQLASKRRGNDVVTPTATPKPAATDGKKELNEIF